MDSTKSGAPDLVLELTVRHIPRTGYPADIGRATTLAFWERIVRAQPAYKDPVLKVLSVRAKEAGDGSDLDGGEVGPPRARRSRGNVGGPGGQGGKE